MAGKGQSKLNNYPVNYIAIYSATWSQNKVPKLPLYFVLVMLELLDLGAGICLNTIMVTRGQFKPGSQYLVLWVLWVQPCLWSGRVELLDCDYMYIRYITLSRNM